jgi:hydrogenase maturation protein HypF
MIKAMVDDIRDNVAINQMAARFHRGIAETFVEVCMQVADRRKIRTIALSGGCFQNSYLLTQCEKLLKQSGFHVLTQRDIPTNDGGLALGQACIANAREL